MTEALLRGIDNKFQEVQSSDQISLFGGYAIAKFKNCGTGFVIKKETRQVSNISPYFH
jgi:hypothetical protein